MKTNQKNGILLVANWDSGVGYAWWLMESFWVLLSETYKDHHRIVLAYPSISNIPKNITQAPIECFKVNFTLTGFRDIFNQCNFLRKNKIRLIYFSDHACWHWRYIAFRLYGVKVIIIHDHTPGVRTVPTGLKKSLKFILARLPWITCDAIIGATPYIKQRAIEVTCFPEEQTYTAQNGLPTLPPSNPIDLHKTFNIPINRKIMVTTGRASKYKGIPFAIKCLIKIIKKYKRQDLHWVFFGDGPHLGEFRDLIQQNNIENFITLTGKRNDIPSLLPGCDFAFHPSQGEVGYSLSILEYMRASLPAIVPDNPSVCGATQHDITGLIYTEEDIQSACQSILKILSNDDYAKELGSNAKEKSRDYTLDITHKELLESMHLIDPALNK